MEHFRNPRVRFPTMMVGLLTLGAAMALLLIFA
jgi:hypothetical protein